MDYFSLNRTSAELVLLKPVDRELHSRFDLVIKVKWGDWGKGGGVTWQQETGMLCGRGGGAHFQKLQDIHQAESGKCTIKSEYFPPGVLMRFLLIKRRLP